MPCTTGHRMKRKTDAAWSQPRAASDVFYAPAAGFPTETTLSFPTETTHFVILFTLILRTSPFESEIPYNVIGTGN